MDKENKNKLETIVSGISSMLIKEDIQFVEKSKYDELKFKLEEKDKIIKDLQQPFIFLKNRINQGMSEENIEKHLIRIGKNIIDNLERSKNEKV